MRKSFILWMGVVLMLVVGMSSCSSDDDFDFLGESGRGDRYLGHSSRHTQVPVPVTMAISMEDFKSFRMKV